MVARTLGIVTVSAEELAVFRRDGVVVLRQRFDRRWLTLLSDTIDQAMADPGPNLARHSTEPDAPGYFEDYWTWNRHAGFTEFVHDSPVGELGAALLGSATANLVMDNWFLREAGSRSRPPFHHDVSYFDFAGSMCVCWLPLEDVTASNGITFARGSHLWGKHFLRVRFGDGHRVDEPDRLTLDGIEYEPPPDIESDPDAYDLVSFDLRAGDCIFFDIRTLHGSLSTVVPDTTVRRYTLRMAGPDAHIRYRGDWASEERAQFEAAGYGPGDRLAGAFFPQLHPREGLR